jgi:hypothetical protein
VRFDVGDTSDDVRIRVDRAQHADAGNPALTADSALFAPQNI